LNQKTITLTIMILRSSTLFANATVNFASLSVTHESLILLLHFHHSSSRPTSYSRLLINLNVGQWWIENSKLIWLWQLIRVVNEFALCEN